MTIRLSPVLVPASVARLDAAARLILRDGELAGDAVQEAFVRASRTCPGCATRSVGPRRSGELGAVNRGLAGLTMPAERRRIAA